MKLARYKAIEAVGQIAAGLKRQDNEVDPIIAKQLYGIIGRIGEELTAQQAIEKIGGVSIRLRQYHKRYESLVDEAISDQLDAIIKDIYIKDIGE